MNENAVPCRVCGSPTIAAGEKMGRLHVRLYHLRRCLSCGFAFVADPDADTEATAR